ncbi:hypothetical protein ASE71_16325 [Ensifer sp. Root954]|nr:hypothetical protein ASD49_31910 [Ensifer sp. Root1298]KQX83735.1 hypothetical protein ASD41_32525 [Ensifer sp. Root1312]KRC20262.1 hypothetical protein ASE29_31940 [Ensifer sp. Root74]KRD78198.1 hypothetical protein ASE71_16325 [Ensifer sp. Root954]
MIAGRLDVLPDDFRHIFIAGELTPVGLGQPGFNLGKLPFLLLNESFDGLCSPIGPRPIQLLSELIQFARGFIFYTHGKRSGHGISPFLVRFDYR